MDETNSTETKQNLRTQAGPPNRIIIQTAHGRYQIEVGEHLLITALDPHAGLVIVPRMSNQVEIRPRAD